MRAPLVGDPLPCAILELCDAIPSVGGSVGGSLAHDAASAVLVALSSALESAAAWLVGHIVALIAKPPTVQLNAPWFLNRADVMVQLAGFVVVPLLLAATIGPVLRQDLRRLARVWGVGLPVGVLAGLLGVQLTQLALSATDALCDAILGRTTDSLGGGLRALTSATVIPGVPELVADVISLLLIVGAVMLWLELVVRATAIYVAVFFMPLALACCVWPATMSIAKRTVELLAALILSKFVIVATLTLGVAAIRGAPAPDNAVIGAAILLLAGFAPFCLLRLAPIVEAGAIAHLEGMSRRPLRFAGRAATTVATGPSHPVAGLLLSAKSGAAQPPQAEPVVPQRIGERSTDYAPEPTPEAGRV